MSHPLAAGFASSANTVLLVVSIISVCLAIVAGIASVAVYFGGTWRKSEMEMLRQSRTDLTSLNSEMATKLATCEVEITAKDQRIAELTSLVTQAKPFEQITAALAKHHQETDVIHRKILVAVERIASRSEGRRG